MNPKIIIATIIATIGFGGGWQIQSWRYASKEKDRAEQELSSVRLSAAATIRRTDNVIDAQNKGAARAVVLRRDLDAAHTELERLRVALSNARDTTGASPAENACPDRTATGNQLLLACAAEVTDLAGKADRHTSDLRTLIDAWPQSK